MINTLLAKKLIERITKYTEYNVNIMDEKGIIIASKDASRIGTFHEVAFQIIQGTEDTIVVDSENAYLGIKRGVNMAIYYKKRKEGVIGVTGEPDEVMSIALVIKMAVEVMLEHEIFKYEKLRRLNLKEQLLNVLLYHDGLEAEDWKQYAEPLNLRDDVIRIPILISIEKGQSAGESVLEIIRNGGKAFAQDLFCITGDGDLLLYKALAHPFKDLMKSYKYLIGEALGSVLRYMRSAGWCYTIYIGSFQSDFRFYRRGYSHCIWLKKQMNSGGGWKLFLLRLLQHVFYVASSACGAAGYVWYDRGEFGCQVFG